METRDTGVDTGQRSGESSHGVDGGDRKVRRIGAGQGGQAQGQPTVPPTERKYKFWRPVENQDILRQKKRVEDLRKQLDANMGALEGMVHIDKGREDARVDLDRMVYLIPAEEDDE